MLALALFLAAAAADPLVAEMQRVEATRNAAIKSGDLATLRRLYAPSFHGISGAGVRVDRETLLNVFKRNAGGDVRAESTILSARRVNGLVFAEGRLKLTNANGALIGDSHYLHIFRRGARGWEMIHGAAVPITGGSR